MNKTIYTIILAILSLFTNAQTNTDTVLIWFEGVDANKVEFVCYGLSEAEADTIDLPLADGYWYKYFTNIEPGFYFYDFLVDNVPAVNPFIEQIYFSKNKHYNGFEVIQPNDSFLIRNNVPFGSINHNYLNSDILDTIVQYSVYSPNGYDFANKSYKTLYLISDIGDKETAWINQGRLLDILDNAIYNNNIDSVLVVLINQNNIPSEEIEMLIIDEIIPDFELNYRALSNKSDRFIAGNLNGGTSALKIVKNNPDKFSSAGMFSIPKNTNLLLESFDEIQNAELDLFFVGAGYNDPGYANIKQFQSQVSITTINYVSDFEQGNNNWLVWRKNLYTMLKLIFE